MRRFGNALLLVAAIFAFAGRGVSAEDCTGKAHQAGAELFENTYYNGGGYYFLKGLAIKGTTLWRTNVEVGLTSYDVSSAAAPAYLGEMGMTSTNEDNPVIVGNMLITNNYWSGLSLYDITDSRNPKFTGSIDTTAWCLDGAACANLLGIAWSVENLATDGSFLYITYSATTYPSEASFHGVQKWDVSSAGNPALLGDIRTPLDGLTGTGSGSFSGSLAVGDGKVYYFYNWAANATDPNGELRVIVADASTMTVIHETDALGTAGGSSQGGAIYKGGHVFLADGYYSNKLLIFDVSNANAVTLCGSAVISKGLLGSIAIAGNILYIDDAGGQDPTTATLERIDITNACSPAVLPAYKGPTEHYTGAVVASEDGKTLYATRVGSAGPEEVAILDVSTSTTAEKGLIKPASGDAFIRWSTATTDGKTSYIASSVNTDGVLIVDSTDPLAPKWIGKYTAGHQALSVDASGGLLVVAGGDNVSFHNIASPTAPVRYTSKKLKNGTAQDATIFGGDKYVAVASAKASAEIYDVTNPAAPVSIALVQGSSTSGDGRGVSINGNIMALACATSGVSIWDVTNPAAPVIKNQLAVIKKDDGTNTDAAYVVVNNAGTAAYVVSFGAGDAGQLTVLDLSVLPAKQGKIIPYPQSPIRQLSIDPDGTRIYIPADWTTSPDHAYIANYLAYPSMDVYDIATDPLNPTLVDSVAVIGSPRTLSVRNGHAYMACRMGESIIDLSSGCFAADLTASANGKTATATDKTVGNSHRTFSFGDFSVAGDAVSTHTYAENGTYAVTDYAFTGNGMGMSTNFTSVVTGGTATPSIAITSPSGGATVSNGAAVTVNIQNFTLDCPADGSKANADGHGNWQLYVDGVVDSAYCASSGSLKKTYSAGSHTIKASLRNNDFSALNPAVEASVTVTISVAPPTPSIRITSPAANATVGNGSAVTVSVQNLTFDCPADGSVANAAGHGHWHLYVDGTADANYDGAFCASSGTLTKTYPAGSHTLVASLRNNDHTPLDPAVNSDPVTITISDVAPAFTAKLAVPGQARAAGSNDSFFRTSFWAANATSAAMNIRLRYYTSAGAPAVDHVDVTIDPDKTAVYSDVLTQAFGATENTSGVIVVEVADGSGTPVVTSRTYNDTPGGTFGQFIPATPISTSTSPMWLLGLGGDVTNRTNVGVVSLSGSPVNATITVYDKTGAVKGTTTAVAPANGSVQLNKVNEKAGAPDLDVFGIKVEGDAPFFAFASKLDNVTSDPIYIPGTLAPAKVQFLDGIASKVGVGAFFKSNLLLSNQGTVAATATVTFTPRNTTGATGTVSVSIAAGESKYYGDAVAELMSLSNAAGYFTITSDQDIYAWARTYNDLSATNPPAPGTYGQFIPGVATSDLIGSTGGGLQGLSENTNFRTNVGFFNTDSADATVEVMIHKADGTEVGVKTYTVPAGQSAFVSKIMNDIMGSTNADLADARLEIIPSVAGKLYAWASFVDNASSDQTFVWPNPLP